MSDGPSRPTAGVFDPPVGAHPGNFKQSPTIATKRDRVG